jgi:hypothetical protein
MLSYHILVSYSVKLMTDPYTQIIGQKWEDEKVLAMMAIIDRALGERGFGPEAGAALNLKVATKSQRESPTPQLLHHVDQSTSPVTSMSIAQDVMR